MFEQINMNRLVICACNSTPGSAGWLRIHTDVAYTWFPGRRDGRPGELKYKKHVPFKSKNSLICCRENAFKFKQLRTDGWWYECKSTISALMGKRQHARSHHVSHVITQVPQATLLALPNCLAIIFIEILTRGCMRNSFEAFLCILIGLQVITVQVRTRCGLFENVCP